MFYEFTHVALFFAFEHTCFVTKYSNNYILTSRPDNDGTNVEESLAEGTFGIHPFDDLTAFCIEKRVIETQGVGRRKG
jgi:hypothetical protein